jgi:hypothetical protein
VAVALGGLAAVALAGGLAIAWTDPGPFGQFFGTAEGAQVLADLHQQLGGGKAVDTREGQQKVQCRLIGFQARDERTPEVGEVGLQGVDMATDHPPGEQVLVARFALQGGGFAVHRHHRHATHAGLLRRRSSARVAPLPMARGWGRPRQKHGGGSFLLAPWNWSAGNGKDPSREPFLYRAAARGAFPRGKEEKPGPDLEIGSVVSASTALSSPMTGFDG